MASGRRQGRLPPTRSMNLPRSCLPSLLAAVLFGLAPRAAAAPLDLTGVVTSDRGQPVPHASVFIDTAGPRIGVGDLCPSCYADCRKSARSGPDGAFRIADLDPSLLFRVLVVAPGFEPTFFPGTDPRNGPLAAVLAPRTAVHPPERTILGRVVDSDGKPVPQAVVSVQTTQIGDTYYGSPPRGTDPLAVADDQGLFTLGSATDFEAMHLRIEARARARGLFEGIRPGRGRRDFVLTEGVTFSGRVLRDGRGVSNIVMGACGTDRSLGNFIGDFVVATDAHGRFALTYLPPDREYYVYGAMSSLTNLGALPVRTARSGRDGTALDLGNLEIRPGYRLAGRVQLPEDQPLPEGTRLLVGREGAWDTLGVALPPDGRFDIDHLPPNETLTLGARVRGHRPSPRNPSFESLNGLGLAGRLVADRTNLVFLLEPGEIRPGAHEPMPESERPENLPLAGIETHRARPRGRTVRGEAVDAESGRRLGAFRVIPGQSLQPEGTYVDWFEGRATESTNGLFSIEMPGSTQFVVLQAEAEGYLPERSPALGPHQPTWRFALRRGRGPEGIVREPGGQQPAAGALVLHLGPAEQASLSAQGELRATLARDAEGRTDGAGRFEFAPKVGPSELVVATDTGFVRAPHVTRKSPPRPHPPALGPRHGSPAPGRPTAAGRSRRTPVRRRIQTGHPLPPRPGNPHG
jgi:hypothetical protein